jgi:hypothetical protein
MHANKQFIISLVVERNAREKAELLWKLAGLVAARDQYLS